MLRPEAETRSRRVSGSTDKRDTDLCSEIGGVLCVYIFKKIFIACSSSVFSVLKTNRHDKSFVQRKGRLIGNELDDSSVTGHYVDINLDVNAA